MPLALFSSRKPSYHSSLRRAAGLGFGLLSLLSLTAGQSAFAAPIQWNGVAGDWFANPSHWIGGSYPGSGDDAINTFTSAITLGQSTTISSFFSSGAFSLQGGTFSGSQANAAGTITVNNVFTDNGGQINNFTVNQGSGGSVVFTGNGGNIVSNSIFNSSIDMATNANALLYVEGAVTANGAINLGTTSNGIQLYGNGSSLTLGSGGNLTGFGTVSQNGGTTLTNNGTVNANSSTNALNLNITTFNNNATAEATGGILNLNNTINNAGLLTTTGGGILNITGTLNSLAGNSINGLGGTVNINGASLTGTLNGVGATSLVFNNGSNILNDGSVFNANLDLATNTNALAYVEGAVTANKAINLGTTSNGIQLYGNGSSLTLGSGGSLTGFGTVSQNGGTTLTNNGTVNANSSTNALNINTSNFANNATAEATNGGTLNFNTGTLNNAGLLTTTGGGILNITGTLNSLAGNSINGLGGTVNINGASLTGTLNGVGATSLVFNNGSNILNDGSVLNANLDLTTNANALGYVEGAVTANKAINLGTTSNGIQLYGNGSSLTLGSGGSLVGFGTVSQNGGTTLINGGLVNANNATNALNINTSNFANNATVEATGGTLAINSGSVTQSGTFAASGQGSVIALAGGTLTGSGSNLFTASNGGQIQINGETLSGTLNTGANTALVFNGSGNILSDGAVLNANLDLTTNTNALAYVEGAVTANKAINLGTTSNGIQLYGNGSSLTLGANGSLAGFGTVSQNGATTLTNNGLVNANSPGNTLNINTSVFNNTGTTEVQNGAALSVTSANTDSGNILVAKGGTATFTQGVTQTAGLTQVDGTLNSPLTLNGGTLKGTGTISGAVVNNGGTVAAGDSPGTLTVSGPFTQAAGGTLDVQFNNTTSSLLSVSGLVTTGGFLDVNYIGSGAYTGGNAPFTFLNYGTLATSLSGTGPTQYFANETFNSSGQGLIAGHNGFTYELLNNVAGNGLQLEVLNNGAPVPEASTTISFGLLMLLGGAGVWAVKRRTSSAV